MHYKTYRHYNYIYTLIAIYILILCNTVACTRVDKHAFKPRNESKHENKQRSQNIYSNFQITSYLID